MMRKRVLLTLCTALLAAATVSAAEQDPSDIFLRAFLAIQTAEKMESDGKNKEALTKFLFAASLLDQIRNNNPDWQPLVLEYRSKKTRDRIAALQGKIGSDQELAPSPVEPALPAEPDNTLIPGASPSPGIDLTPVPETTGAPGSETEELRRQLNEAKLEVKRLRQENITLTQRYEQSSANLREALKRVDQSRIAVAELRSQVAQSEDRLRSLMADRTATAQQLETAKAEIDRIKKELDDRVADRDLITDEADDLSGQIAASNQAAALANSQRDDAVKARDVALAEVKQLQADKERSDQVLAENAQLIARLDVAEKQVAELTNRSTPEEVTTLKKQIADIQAQLAAAQEQNTNFQASIEDLKKQLDDSNKALAEAKNNNVGTEETARLTSENSLLRNIVLRSLKIEIKRKEAREIVDEELAKVEGKSDILLAAVDKMGSTNLQLSDEERKLFKEPELQALDATAENTGLSVEATSESGAPQPPAATPPPENTAAADGSAPPTPAATPEASDDATVPSDLAPLVEKARGYFEKGIYGAAEKTYNEILNEDPNNLYALSNLGVVNFKSGKLVQAEKVLSKAVVVAPKDFFVRSTLGIVYYKSGKYEKAIESLTQALTIDPTNAQAHNYLGIAASQKGWREAAIQELSKAIALSPRYADAYFNLAVIYATGEPPSLDLAKENYDKALELGASPDPSLEKLLH